VASCPRSRHIFHPIHSSRRQRPGIQISSPIRSGGFRSFIAWVGVPGHRLLWIFEQRLRNRGACNRVRSGSTGPGAFVFGPNQRTFARPANLRLGWIKDVAFGIAAADRLRPVIAKRPKDRDHQLTISRMGGLVRINVSGVAAGVQCGHFLRWFAIRRLVRNTSASAWRSSPASALRAINAKCASYFSRSSPAIALNFGQVARNIEHLLNRVEKSLLRQNRRRHRGEGPR
jgi:hypothetical protein